MAHTVDAADLSLEESYLADTSNEDDTQRISTQTRAAVLYLGNKDITEQQAHERARISRNPTVFPLSPTTFSPPAPHLQPTRKAASALIKASESSMDWPRTARCRARTTALTPRLQTTRESHQATRERRSQESGPSSRPMSFASSYDPDYWLRQAKGNLSNSNSTSSPEDPQPSPEQPPPPLPRSQSQSQSQSQPRSQSQSQPQPQPEPQTTPRPQVRGLIQRLSQLSTSDTSQNQGEALVSGSSGGQHHSPMVDYTSDQSNRSIDVVVPPPQGETQPTQLQTQLDFLPGFERHYTGFQPTSSQSLGGDYLISSPDRGRLERASSPVLDGGPSPVRQGAFGRMNESGGSSPYAYTSAPPTQKEPEPLTQDEDESGPKHQVTETQGTAPTQIVTPETQGTAPTQIVAPETQGTAPTQIVTPDYQCASATPAPPTAPSSRELGDHGLTSGETEGGREDISPTRTVNPEPLGADVEMHNATENPSPSLPDLTTPHRTSEPVTLQGGASPSRRPMTTPQTSNAQPPLKLDRSRKSGYEPPVRTKPAAQLPLPRLNLGGGELSSSTAETPWDAATAEQEERDARAASGQQVQHTAEQRRIPVSGVGGNDFLTASTPFVSGKGKEVARTRPVLNTQSGDSNDTLEGETKSPPRGTTLSKNPSSQPLELGRQQRLKEQQVSPVRESEPEHESEEEAPPRTSTPARGGKQAPRRGRGRGRGRGKGRGGTTRTPHTPHEVASRSASPTKSGPSTTKKRPRGGTVGELSPAGSSAKRVRVQAGPTGGTRVLAWWSRGKDCYFGSIVGRDKNRFTVQFDDDDTGITTLDKLYRAELRVGDRVKINMHDKSASHHGEAIVEEVSRWKSDRVARVAVGDAHIDVSSEALLVLTKDAKSSWHDRRLSEDEIVVPTNLNMPMKRRVSSGHVAVTGTNLSGYAFVLTLKAEDVGTGDEDNLDEWKIALRAKIEAQGGIIADDWGELFTVQGQGTAKGWAFEATEEGAFNYVGKGRIRQVFLLSGKAGVTAKYMMALALGVPCLSHRWIDDFLHDASISWLRALLPSGQSDHYGTTVSQLIHPRVQAEADMVKAIVETQSSRRPFKDKAVLCIFKKGKKNVKDPNDKGQFFSRVACVLGAASVQLIHDTSPWPIERQPTDFDFVVCETPSVKRALEEQGATCCTSDWVKQCIIMGQALPVDE